MQVKGAECVVMAGDPCQLPPTVLSPPTSEAAQELQHTLYARLADAGWIATEVQVLSSISPSQIGLESKFKRSGLFDLQLLACVSFDHSLSF